MCIFSHGERLGCEVSLWGGGGWVGVWMMGVVQFFKNVLLLYVYCELSLPFLDTCKCGWEGPRNKARGEGIHSRRLYRLTDVSVVIQWSMAQAHCRMANLGWAMCVIKGRKSARSMVRSLKRADLVS